MRIDRRTLLAGAAAGMLPPASLPAAGAHAPFALSPAGLLDCYVRMRAATDGRLTYGWLDSLRYAVIDGEAHPLFRVLAGTIQRCVRRDASHYEATILEIVHYVDVDSAALLRTLRMPVAGHVVDVPPYRFGPTRVRFAVDLDEREDFAPEQESKDAAAFAPGGRVEMRRTITEPAVTSGALSVRHEEHGRLVPSDPSAPQVSYREWTIWRADSAQALDPARASCPAEVAYTAMTSWRPWMRMAAVPGHTLDSGRGGKCAELGELPANYLALTRELHPDVFADAAAALDE